jgi:fluoroacetyl-CoA thioesterase
MSLILQRWINTVGDANRLLMPMRQIPPGAKGSSSLLVQPEHLANRFKDSMLPPILATPVMIMVMENAALNAIKAYLDPGESAVGTAVNIRHLSATPVGRQVTGDAEVTKVDGRQIEFRVRATEGEKEIGTGSHSRAVIDIAKFARRLAGA